MYQQSNKYISSIIEQNFLIPGQSDEDLKDKASPGQAQHSKRMTQSMTHDPGLGQDHPLASALQPIIPQRITRSRAHVMGAKHQLVSLFVISID